MYRRVDEVDAPPGSGIVLSGIYAREFRQLQVDTDDDLQASQATTEPSSSQASDSQQAEGLVLERVQPTTRFAYGEHGSGRLPRCNHQAGQAWMAL